MVFTDNGSKDLKLKEEILRIKKKKELELYIVLTPDYEGRPNDESLRVNLSFLLLFFICVSKRDVKSQ